MSRVSFKTLFRFHKLRPLTTSPASEVRGAPINTLNLLADGLVRYIDLQNLLSNGTNCKAHKSEFKRVCG